MSRMRRTFERLGRGFLFGFSAAIGVWIALLLLTIVVMLILRPWG